MEPFFLRCETCQARLRVREERFLGQIQSCPKCGSMVQIIAPAGWLAQGEGAPESPPQLDEITAASTTSAAASAIHWLRSHTLVTAAGATGVIAACGLAAFLVLRGDEQVAALPTPRPAVETTADVPAESLTEPAQQDNVPAETALAETVDAEAAAAAEGEVAHDEPVVAPESPSEPPQDPTVAEPVQAAASSSSFLPLVTPPAVEASEPSNEAQSPRKLTLELVRQDAKPAPAIVPPAVAAYPAEVEAEAAEIETANGVPTKSPAKPPASSPAEAPVEASNLPSLDPPAHRTNIMDQLSMPIDSITLPDVPIGEFVGFVSTMTAVPIELDPKVLGEVGLSSRSTVTVHGEATTAGKLLARVLKEHQLTCIEREGTLVVVRAKR